MVVQVSFICASEHFFDNAEADSEKSVYSSGPIPKRRVLFYQNLAEDLGFDKK